MHAADDPARDALEVVGEPGGRQGLQVGDAQLEGPLDHAVHGQLVARRRRGEAVGHGVEGEAPPAGDQAGEPCAAQRLQQVGDAVLHVLAHGDPERAEAQDAEHGPPADGLVALAGGRAPGASRWGQLSHSSIVGRCAPLVWPIARK